jgi:hypothetical protein
MRGPLHPVDAAVGTTGRNDSRSTTAFEGGWAGKHFPGLRKTAMFFPQHPWARRLRRAGSHGWLPRACAQQDCAAQWIHGVPGKMFPDRASEHEIT